MPDEPKALRNDLIKIIVEKLLIGAIVLLLGVVAQNVVDSAKTQRSFSTELNKTRVEKISEVWEKIGIYEGTFEIKRKGFRTAVKNELDKVLPSKKSAEPTPTPRIDDEVQTQLRKANAVIDKLLEPKKSYEEVLVTINKNRLWLGEDNYKQIRDYLELSERVLFPTDDVTAEKLKETEDAREKARANIITIRDRLFAE